MGQGKLTVLQRQDIQQQDAYVSNRGLRLLMTAESLPVFQIKGGLFPLTALQLLSTDLANLSQQIEAKLKEAPKFFQNAPIVIDLQKINKPDSRIDFRQLKTLLQARNLIPVGIKGGSNEQQQAAIEAGFAVLQETMKESNAPTSQTAPASPGPSESSAIQQTEIGLTPSRLVTEPVRSGQQIYARGGDLIVIAPVSHGAELLADGHIHVYGSLRGRALAGVTGDTKARIFCQNLEAELVSVAGHYKISEDIEQAFWRASVDIFLDQGRLHIQPL